MVDPGCGETGVLAQTTRADNRAHRCRRYRDSGCFIADAKTLSITDENCGNETEFAMVFNPTSSFIRQIKTPF